MPASSPASPMSSKSCSASFASSPVSCSPFFAFRRASTRLLRMVLIGCRKAVPIFFAPVSNAFAKPLTLFVEKSIAPVIPVPKLLAMLFPASRPSAIVCLNASPRLSASWAVFLICARKASASSPASSRPLPNCRVVFSAALVALPTFCAAAAASSAASEKAAAPFRAAVQAETVPAPNFCAPISTAPSFCSSSSTFWVSCSIELSASLVSNPTPY